MIPPGIHRALFAVIAICLALPHELSAQTTYTFNAASTSGTNTYNWSAGTGAGWSASLGNGSSTTALKFSGLFSGTPTVTSNDDIATGLTIDGNSNVYSLNQLSVVTTGSALLNITGNALYLTGAAPTISLNAGTGETVTIANNLIFGSNTTITTATSGTDYFTGTLEGTGNITFSGNVSLYLNSPANGSSSNAGYAYQGATITNNDSNLYLTANTGLGAGNLFTTAGLVSNGLLHIEYSGISVTSLTGSGTITKDSGGGTTNGITVDYNQSGTDIYGGQFTGGSKAFSMIGAGSFDLSNASGQTGSNLTLGVLGTGFLTLSALNNTSSNFVLLDKGTLTLTSNVNNTLVAGGATALLNGGTLSIQPAAGASGTVTVTGISANSNQLRYRGGGTLQLNRNGNAGLVFTIGNAGDSGMLARANNGTLIIAPTDGFAGLGSTEQLQVLGTLGTGAPGSNNNIWNPSVVAVDSGGNLDFATYITSAGALATSTTVGSSSDIGFMALSTAATSGSYSSLFSNYTTSLGAATNASLVELAGNQGTVSPGASPSAYALRIDGGTTLSLSGIKLTLGNGSGQAGLILNGATISSGTLAFGAAEAVIYASGSDASISSNMTGSAGLTKSGIGTLFLTGSNSFTAGSTTVDEGALDVGTMSGATSSSNGGALPSAFLVLQGADGILQGNGSFTRALATSGNFTLELTTGGFAARNGSLSVNLGGASAQQTWGGATFLTDATTAAGSVNQIGVFAFGSDTSNGQVDFQNAIALGATNGAYYREVNVTSGQGGDSAKLSGVISDTAGSAGSHGLLKTGNGTLILSAANTYTGQTYVAAGSLLIDGATTGQGSYTVSPLTSAGALIGGKGTIGLASGQTLTLAGVSATQQAFISPGDNSLNVNAAGSGQLVNNGIAFTAGAPSLMNSQTAGGTGGLDVGTLNVTGNILGNGYDVFNFLLQGDTASLLAINGNLTLAGNDTLALSLLGGTQTLGEYTLITYTGALTGTFSTADLPAGFSIDYGTSGEINVDYSAVPEPRDWVLAGIGLLTLSIRFRRKSQRTGNQ